MNGDPQGRHLTTPGLMAHWENGAPLIIPVPGTPSLRLRIDPPQQRLTLRAPLPPGIDAPASALAHVEVTTLVEEDRRYMEISTTDAKLVVDGYAMLRAVADRIQLANVTPPVALEETLATWQSILATRMRLSSQAEIGLVGELLFLGALLETDSAAASAWRGGLREEHDFGFPTADVEIKTTSGERRRHWIHGLAQLVETGETPLWLVSIQVTRGGDEQGQKLSALVDQVLTMASGPHHDRVVQNLAAAGWHDEERDLYHDAWRLRSIPLALRVGDDLPRLTPALLSGAGIDTARLRQVTYEIDVTDRSPSPDQAGDVTKIVERMKATVDG